MTTIRDIISGSLRLLEVLGAGEAPTAEDAADCLKSLNAMIASWSIDGKKIWTESIDTFTLTSGTASYTLGTGGTLNASLPVKIKTMTLGTVGTQPSILDMLSVEEYADQSDDNLSGIPLGVYNSGGYPLQTLYFTCKPDQAYELKIYGEKPLSAYSSINDTFIAPPGVERAIKYNLAVEVAAEYGKTPKPDVKKIAQQSKAALEAQYANIDAPLSVDDALLYGNETYNILTST